MVQVFTDPAVSRHATANSVSDKPEGEVMSREEHAQRMKELAAKRGMKRAPSRGWSMTDYQGDYTPPSVPQQQTITPQLERHAPIPEHSPWPPSTAASPAPSPATTQPAPPKDGTVQLPRRPKLPPPRRSHSVMDYEPVPVNQPKPSSRLTLLDLPSELHYLFCDYLDPIDSVCFGLAHSKLYTIHRRKYGKVALSSRYSGPNDLEWAWRGAGPLVSSPNQDSTSERAHMRIKGQVYCRKCGISRCELHRHLKEWMGEEMEYCEIRETYGKPASEERKPYCYMSSPRNPHRCGRHGGKSRN
ncbi:unnamed protein product [Clonostachys rhizophaga]|uniref:F-box domain-containing protein n=1 Tax=Clonostachys rhizophaga TaxID=160324 RepID=A0A9N9V3C9_9HYPO|nr:unnamed protein product [Clonostachys rhizophaga]